MKDELEIYKWLDAEELKPRESDASDIVTKRMQSKFLDFIDML